MSDNNDNIQDGAEVSREIESKRYNSKWGTAVWDVDVWDGETDDTDETSN
jgi:CYTH domain-containing protein